VPVPDSTAPATAAPRGLFGAPATCTLAKISDGDTIECRDGTKVRLIGVDAPESDQEPFGTAATAGLASIAPVGTVVRLELDRDPRDQRGRLLAYLWQGDSLVNLRLVRHGWAVSARYPPNLRHAAALDEAEQAARREGRGLWSVNGFSCRPANHRRKEC